MSYLVLNGIAVKVAVPGLTAPETPVGEDFERAYSGGARSQLRAQKRSWKGATTWLDSALVENLRQLLRGAGHTWTFDGESGTTHYSALKGLPGTGASSSIGTLAPAPKFGANRLKVNSGTTWTATVPSSSAWTIMGWVWNGAAWTHYIVDSSSRKWVDGVRNDAASTAFFSGTTTTVNLLGYNTSGAAADAYFDDVVYLPYVFADTTWPAQIVAVAASFGLPRLTATGTKFPTSTSVVGRPESVKDVKAESAIYSALEFSLEEV